MSWIYISVIQLCNDNYNTYIMLFFVFIKNRFTDPHWDNSCGGPKSNYT